MNNRVITFIFVMMLLTIILVAIYKCSTTTPPPDNTRLTTERKEHLAKAGEKEIVVKEIYRDRIKTRTHYDTIIKEVETFDSTTVKIYYDSLVQSQLNAVTNYYKLKSCKAELSKMDSIYSLDSAIKSALRKAIAISDTIHANDSLALLQAKKTIQKERNGKRLWQAGFFILGTLLIIK